MRLAVYRDRWLLEMRNSTVEGHVYVHGHVEILGKKNTFVNVIHRCLIQAKVLVGIGVVLEEDALPFFDKPYGVRRDVEHGVQPCPKGDNRGEGLLCNDAVTRHGDKG